MQYGNALGLHRFTLVLMGVAVTGMVGPAKADRISRVDLGGTWHVSSLPGHEAIAATVPGCVHTDLLAAGKIADPYSATTNGACSGSAKAIWIYRRSLRGPAELWPRNTCCCAAKGWTRWPRSASTAAEIAQTDNMFRTYEFDVNGLLKAGSNEIEIRFEAVLPFDAGQGSRA